MRKLTQLRPADDSTPRVFVRFVSPGLIDENGPRKDSSGYTVWSFKPDGSPVWTYLESIDDALTRALRPDL